MARARNIKPAFFMNDDLGQLCFEARLLFIGLWTLADREGRLKDRPLRIKAELFPYDDVDCDVLLGFLSKKDFILRYMVDGECYIQVINFCRHQNPHKAEKMSEIPPFEVRSCNGDLKHGASMVLASDANGSSRADSLKLIPNSLNKIPDNRASIKNMFDEFWAVYPKKRSKAEALKAFTKVCPDEELLEVMIERICFLKGTSDWQKCNGQFIPYPATWLNGRRWEDEVSVDSVSSKKVMSDLERARAIKAGYVEGEDEVRVIDVTDRS